MGWFTAFNESIYPDHFDRSLEQSETFDIVNANILAWAAQLAYETDDDEKLRRILKRWGWEDPLVLLGHFASHLPLVSTKGYMAKNRNITIISFAGTEPTDLFNWITDFYIHRTADGVAEGFLAGVEAVWDLVSAGAKAAAGPIYLAGHSLGAALAGIAAYRLISESDISPDRIAGVYTIGMPRIGNYEYAKAYNAAVGERTYRLVYGRDIVPQVPPAPAPFNSRHIGRVLSCSEADVFDPTKLGPLEIEAPGNSVATFDQIRSALGEPPQGSKRDYPGQHALSTVVASNLAPAFRDHLPDSYLRAFRSEGQEVRQS